MDTAAFDETLALHRDRRPGRPCRALSPSGHLDWCFSVIEDCDEDSTEPWLRFSFDDGAEDYCGSLSLWLSLLDGRFELALPDVCIDAQTVRELRAFIEVQMTDWQDERGRAPQSAEC